MKLVIATVSAGGREHPGTRTNNEILSQHMPN